MANPAPAPVTVPTAVPVATEVPAMVAIAPPSVPPNEAQAAIVPRINMMTPLSSRRHYLLCKVLCQYPAKCFGYGSCRAGIDHIASYRKPSHQHLWGHSADGCCSRRSQRCACCTVGQLNAEHSSECDRHCQLDRRDHRIITARNLRKTCTYCSRRCAGTVNDCMALAALLIGHGVHIHPHFPA